jgi:Tfp pilus assembly protein PilN
MAQQINLCTPILLTQRRYFSAETMVQALAVFLVLGGGLCAYWVWSLNVASANYQQTVATQKRELEGLLEAIRLSKADTGPAAAAAAQALEASQAELGQREGLLGELQRGLFQPGWGHAARMQLVAQSIPAKAWITEMQADDNRLDVSGFTLEPAVLNDWVSGLAASPLLQGQELSSVKVESTSARPTSAAPAPTPAVPASAAVVSAPLWSFNLLSRVAKPPVAVGDKS